MTESANKRVFIAGSRSLSRLNVEVRRRIDNIVEKGFTILVGDANGVDKAVQKHLDARRYENVLVYCMENHCRNNIGSWPQKRIPKGEGQRGFAYYSAKDRAMAREADYGLMLWDGRSRGTLTNIVDLARAGKAVVVYVSPQKQFHTVKGEQQLSHVLRDLEPGLLDRVDHDLVPSASPAWPLAKF